MGRYANEAAARRTVQEVQIVCAQPPQPLARTEGVGKYNIYMNIYMGNVHNIQ